jgi:hypothetical protein
MSEERAVFAGGCFWGVQDLFRRYDGVLSTRVGYTGGSTPNATYRNHGRHAEAVEITFDLPGSAIGSCSNSFSRFTIQPRATVRETTSGRATDRRSSTRTKSSVALRRTRSPTSTSLDCGRARSSPSSSRRATSGKRNPSIRTTCCSIPAATPVTSSGQAGSCPSARASEPDQPTRAGNDVNPLNRARRPRVGSPESCSEGNR